MIALAALLGAHAADALVQPFSTPTPEPSIEALVLLGANPGQRTTCEVTAIVDPFGDVLDAAPGACPPELSAASAAAVRTWKFHPPTADGQAVKARYDLRFVYISNTVLTDAQLDPGDVLVRLNPTAVPRWPSPYRVSRSSEYADQRCVLDLRVDDRDLPEFVRTVDCPDEVEDAVKRRLRRFGLDTIGSTAGDGTVYRLDLALR